VLLTTTAYYGTLAAVRNLGRNAIAVRTAGPSRWGVASWSRYSRSHDICPRVLDAGAFLDWLVEFGRTHERHVLLPTCDDTAWLYARYHDLLSEHFYVGSASIQAVHGVLHKGLLGEHARAVGLDVPQMWFPESEADLLEICRTARFPLLLKPTTQVLFESRSKGSPIGNGLELQEKVAAFTGLRHARPILDYDATAARPMVQEFFPSANNSVYNISSYTREGKLIGPRAGRKILQNGLLGTGICFEEAPVDASLMSGLERLVARVGFSGVFEAEFVQSDGRSMLIDFNPRFYNQMQFDVARGVPLPIVAYFDAIRGEHRGEVDLDEPTLEPSGDKIFVYGAGFKLRIAAQRIAGALSPGEAHHWFRWYQEHEGRRVDAVHDGDDVWPARLDLLQLLHFHLRHPRNFLRSVALNR
jgi:D-aspartate ligase